MRVGHLDIDEFMKWTKRRDARMRALIERKIDYLAFLGVEVTMPLVRNLGGDLFELRVSKYRLYFIFARFAVDGREQDGILFVTYGEKDTQQRDIERARAGYDQAHLHRHIARRRSPTLDWRRPGARRIRSP